MALTASSTVPKAVRRMTSTSGAMVLAARSSSSPVRPGILRSVTMRSIAPSCRRSRAARPSEASSTRYPSRVSVRSRLSRSPGSSSATSSVRSGMRDLHRQPDREHGAAPRPIRPAQLAAMLLDDLARDREPEPRALRLRGEELLEEAVADLGGDARARVGHRDLDGVAERAARNRERAAARERLEAVLHEIVDGLAEQHAVDLHGGDERIGLDRHDEPLAVGDGPHEGRQLLDEVVDRLLLEVRLREAREHQVLLGESVEGVDLITDGRQEPARLL